MVLMMSFALLVFPNFNPFTRSGQPELGDLKPNTPGNSRRLMTTEHADTGSQGFELPPPYGPDTVKLDSGLQKSARQSLAGHSADIAHSIDRVPGVAPDSHSSEQNGLLSVADQDNHNGNEASNHTDSGTDITLQGKEYVQQGNSPVKDNLGEALHANKDVNNELQNDPVVHMEQKVNENTDDQTVRPTRTQQGQRDL